MGKFADWGIQRSDNCLRFGSSPAPWAPPFTGTHQLGEGRQRHCTELLHG